MKKSYLLSAVVLLSLSTATFGATLKSLNKAEATKELEGNTITTVALATINDNLVTNAFTGYFGKDGKMQGQFANAPENQPQKDQGTWTVKADGTTCSNWDQWNNKQPVCFSVYKLSNGLLFINSENKKFLSLVLQENIKPGNQM